MGGAVVADTMGRVSTPPGRWPTGRRWAWWHRRRPATRQTIRGALAVVAAGALSLVVGVSTAHAEAPLGPHEASYEVTLTPEIRVDLGPLGAMILDSPLPWPVGLDIVVGAIPAGSSGDSLLPVLLGDVEAYGQLFTVPEAAVADAANALVADALGRAVVLWSVLLATLAAGRLASGGRLREELKRALAKPGVGLLAAAAVLTAGAAAIVPAVQQRPPEGRTIALLAGTPLQGARVTGRLGDVVETYGASLRAAVEENERFYAEVGDNLAAAYETDPEPLAPTGPPAPAPHGGEVPVPAPSGETGQIPAPEAGGQTAGDEEPVGTDPAGRTPAGRGTAVTRATGDPDTAAPAPVTFVVVADLHCNVGMADVVARAVELSRASAVLDAGDTVMSGTSVESFCVNAFADAVGGRVPWVVAPGNHDSTETAEQERAAGFTVLDGRPVEVDGVRILGDTDPTLTTIGEGTRPERAETVLEMGDRLADTACEDGDVDLLLVHNPRAGEAATSSGCVPLQVSGHWHRRVGPEPAGPGVRYVSTSTGGAAAGGRTMGPLQTGAEMTVLRVDAATGRPLDYRIVSIAPDATVSLAEWRAFPARPPAEEPSASDGSPSPS